MSNHSHRRARGKCRAGAGRSGHSTDPLENAIQIRRGAATTVHHWRTLLRTKDGGFEVAVTAQRHGDCILIAKFVIEPMSRIGQASRAVVDAVFCSSPIAPAAAFRTAPAAQTVMDKELAAELIGFLLTRPWTPPFAAARFIGPQGPLFPALLNVAEMSSITLGTAWTSTW